MCVWLAGVAALQVSARVFAGWRIPGGVKGSTHVEYLAGGDRRDAAELCVAEWGVWGTGDGAFHAGWQ